MTEQQTIDKVLKQLRIGQNDPRREQVIKYAKKAFSLGLK